ncbi:MAG: 6-bladed beta-propeller [Bacteroidales bacterium]|jgi:hypothetical protein|nr:6-bladed beta-propeller [Bacteroidales bacterium]
MKKTVLIIGILLFSFGGCKNQKDVVEGIDSVLIDFEHASTLDFDAYFSKIEIIPLASNENSLIANCEKLILNENKQSYMIFDYKQGGIFCFDKQGRFLFNSLNKKGEGPEEYSVCFDFVYNTFDSTYEFLDPMGVIQVYDENMNFIKRIKINDKEKFGAIQFFMPISHDIYALYNYTDENEMLYFYSKSKEKIIKTISLPKIMDFLKLNAAPFSKINDVIFFNSASISNTIYQINPKTLSLLPVMIDYGNKTLTEEIGKNYNIKESGPTIFEENKYAFPLKITQNEKAYYILSMWNKKIYFSIYDKKTKQIITGNKFSNDLIITMFNFATNEALYCITVASHINSAIDINYLTEEGKIQLPKIQEDDNPIIVKYYLKQ